MTRCVETAVVAEPPLLTAVEREGEEEEERKREVAALQTFLNRRCNKECIICACFLHRLVRKLF